VYVLRCHIVYKVFKSVQSINMQNVNPSQVRLLVGFQQKITRVISTIPSFAHHQHVPLCCTKWPLELKLEKSCPAVTGQATCGFSTKLYKSAQNHPWYAHHRHVPLSCTKWPPELNIENSRPAFTDQTTGFILTKLFRSDQYQPLLCTTILARSASPHKMAVRALNYRNILSCCYRSNYW
jgi:hypothetical protein